MLYLNFHYERGKEHSLFVLLIFFCAHFNFNRLLQSKINKRNSALLCVPYKILERLIYARVEPLIDPLLPKEQAGFRHRKSTVDQVVLLTQNIEDSFEAKKKAGAVCINLTAAYDTVWHRGLTCKLLRLLPDKHMVRMIMEHVRNRSFTFTTGDSKQSRLRRLKNGVPQGSVLALLLFNIYTYDLPSMISRKFAYADDLALLDSSGNWKDLEGTLSQDMSTLSAYLQTWRLKLSHTKTVTAAFHLNNREATRELKVYNNGRLLPFCPTPTYFGVKFPYYRPLSSFLKLFLLSFKTFSRFRYSHTLSLFFLFLSK